MKGTCTHSKAYKKQRAERCRSNQKAVEETRRKKSTTIARLVGLWILIVKVNMYDMRFFRSFSFAPAGFVAWPDAITLLHERCAITIIWCRWYQLFGCGWRENDGNDPRVYIFPNLITKCSKYWSNLPFFISSKCARNWMTKERRLRMMNSIIIPLYVCVLHEFLLPVHTKLYMRELNTNWRS